MPENSFEFTKGNIDKYLNELSKECKKIGGRKLSIEIILTGGAAIIENYGFRNMTTDIDAILSYEDIVKTAINNVGDKFGLPNGWLNSDLMKTESYSPKLRQYSRPYRTFNQILNVRTISGEYMIAMKLKAARRYKNDLSDVIGILSEHQKAETPISYEMIDTAVKNLYRNWDEFSPRTVSFLKDMLTKTDLDSSYKETRKDEIEAKKTLMDFQEKYPGVLNTENIDVVLNKQSKQKASFVETLKNMNKNNND